MRVCAVFVLLLLSVVCVLSSTPAASQETSSKPVDLSPAQMARAKELFGEKCARCHGADGRGRTEKGEQLGVPDFTNSKWWKDHGHDDLIESITNGEEEMPAFSTKLTKTEISLLADYVRHFNQPDH